ncbi:hypothetical protein T484DRAFT_1761717 [Baffinella frigidus]|nr:hypothetical protein T484DRAFT_1761717 [Cryptophyta sp. CCMP2293]
MRRTVLVVAALCCIGTAHAFAPAPLALKNPSHSSRSRNLNRGVKMQQGGATDRRSLVIKAASLLGAIVSVGVSTASAADADQSPASAKPKFRRVPRIQFVAALGDPSASSGTGAETWGLWVDDPGPRGVMLDKYTKLEKNGGKAPAGWEFDSAELPPTLTD